jgi:hypothetical protein
MLLLLVLLSFFLMHFTCEQRLLNQKSINDWMSYIILPGGVSRPSLASTIIILLLFVYLFGTQDLEDRFNPPSRCLILTTTTCNVSIGSVVYRYLYG